MRCRESVTGLLLLEPELANQSAGALHFIGHQLAICAGVVVSIGVPFW
jgi:hypothetical protein